MGAYAVADVVAWVRAHEQEWRRRARSRDRYPDRINDDKDLMIISGLDMGC